MSIVGVLVGPSMVVAIEGPATPAPIVTNSDIKITNPLKIGNNTILDLINLILRNIVMPIAGLVAVVYIIWAGFTYVMAQGNSTELKKAHDRLLWSLVGTGILLGATGISAVLTNTIKQFITP